jgi:hypothetical protein
MEQRGLWRAGIAVAAAAVVGTLVLGARNAPYEGPPGQRPVTDLDVHRLRDAFNDDAGVPRIILSLSPT